MFSTNRRGWARLRVRFGEGHKADGDWKPQAYQAVVEKLNYGE